MKPARLPTSAIVRRRWISLFLFFTVFSLPLHFHVASAVSAQLNKDCVCVQGHRTQLGQIAVPAAGTATVSVIAILPVAEERFISQLKPIQLSRAPPRR